MITPYKAGNQWQVNRYAYMADYNRRMGINELGSAKKSGNVYPHILKRSNKNDLHNFLNEPEILEEVKARFDDHKGSEAIPLYSSSQVMKIIHSIKVEFHSFSLQAIILLINYNLFRCNNRIFGY